MSMNDETRTHCNQPMRYEKCAETPDNVIEQRRLTGTYYCERCQTMQPTYDSVAMQPAPEAGGEWSYKVITGRYKVYDDQGEQVATADNERHAAQIVRDHHAVPMLVKALTAAIHAMKAYQHGNSDPTLANEIEEHATAALNAARGGGVEKV